MKPTEAPKRPRRYNWADYADGQWRLAEQGTDYDSFTGFKTAASAWAAQHGYKFHMHKVPGGMEFQLVPPAPQEEGSADANR